MLKKTMTYIDFNGTERTEDFLFHLSEREAVKLASKYGGDLEAYVIRMQQNLDSESMIDFLETMILTSYGRKSADGRRFEKSEAIKMEFENSQVYSDLFMELLTEPKAAEAFGLGLAQGSKGDKTDDEDTEEEDSEDAESKDDGVKKVTKISKKK